MKIAFQMEPMERTDRHENHTLLMMQEACRRGYDIFHFDPATISLKGGRCVVAPVARVIVDLNEEHYYTLEDYQTHTLSDFDVIFFRQDPPFDMAYVTNTYLLERVRNDGILLVNDPFWIRNMPDKLSIFDFPEFLPPILVTREQCEILEFFAIHKDVVVKPLYGFHGHGIIRTSDTNEALKKLKQHDEPLMFQPYLPAIKEGNKRVVFYDGEIVGALKSVPPEGEFRIFRESVDVAYELTQDDLKICEVLGTKFKERGLIFIGIDLIGEHLIEINAGSVGSLRRLNTVYDTQFESKLWDVIEMKLSH